METGWTGPIIPCWISFALINLCLGRERGSLEMSWAAVWEESVHVCDLKCSMSSVWFICLTRNIFVYLAMSLREVISYDLWRVLNVCFVLSGAEIVLLHYWVTSEAWLTLQVLCSCYINLVFPVFSSVVSTDETRRLHSILKNKITVRKKKLHELYFKNNV